MYLSLSQMIGPVEAFYFHLHHTSSFGKNKPVGIDNDMCSFYKNLMSFICWQGHCYDCHVVIFLLRKTPREHWVLLGHCLNSSVIGSNSVPDGRC